jgi:NADH-quinone oxidoreductase subunit A
MAEGAILFKPILALLLLSVVTAIIMIAVSAFLGPKRDKKSKLTVYECGAVPKQDSARRRYSVKFFVIAMLFILFDIEVAFLYPWAVVYKKYISTGSFILVEMAFFVAVLLVGYIYIWWKGALEWE